MPAYSEICLRLVTLKYDALSKAAAEKNTTVENLLQSKLGELYLEYVPADLQKQISAELAVIFHEEAETKRRRAERERETVLKLRDVGLTWWLGHTTLSDLRIAVRLKQVLRFCTENPAGSFCANLRAKCYISEKEFDSKTIDYLQGKTTTTNSVVLDFECLAHVFPPQHSAVLRRPKALQLQAFCGCLLIFQWLHRSPKSSLLTQLGEN